MNRDLSYYQALKELVERGKKNLSPLERFVLDKASECVLFGSVVTRDNECFDVLLEHIAWEEKRRQGGPQ